MLFLMSVCEAVIRLSGILRDTKLPGGTRHFATKIEECPGIWNCAWKVFEPNLTHHRRGFQYDLIELHPGKTRISRDDVCSFEQNFRNQATLCSGEHLCRVRLSHGRGVKR